MIPAIITGLSALAGLISTIISATQQSKQNRIGGSQGRMGGQQGGLPQGALQIPKFNPQTMEGLQQLLDMGLQGWQQNQPNFGPIRDKALADFQSNVIPSIAERFAGTSRRSSGLEGALGAAGAGLSRDLGALEQGFGQQNRNQLLQLLQLGTQPQYDNAYKTRQPGFGENLTVSAAPAVIQHAPEIIKMFGEWFKKAPDATGGK